MWGPIAGPTANHLALVQLASGLIVFKRKAHLATHAASQPG
jgi:hypothetical protein